MEIDAVRLSKEDHEQHMRKGRCFICHNHGHMARNCPQKKQGKPGRFNNQNRPSKATQVRSLLKELSGEERKQLLEEFKPVNNAARIRAMMQELSEEDKEALVEEAATDFQ